MRGKIGKKIVVVDNVSGKVFKASRINIGGELLHTLKNETQVQKI